MCGLLLDTGCCSFGYSRALSGSKSSEGGRVSMRALTVLLTILLGGIFQAAPPQIAPYGLEKPTPAGKNTVTTAENLRREMRKLWSDHVFWMRDYAAAAIA